jgi:large repetitive protein
MAFHDTRHTGLSSYNTLETPFVIKWRLESVGGGGVNTGIAIGNDGTLYFGSDDFSMNAAYPNGTLKWRYHGGGWFRTTPAIADDGTVYAGSWDDYLYAFLSNGSLKWRHDCGGTICYSSPVIGSDGTIYVGQLNNRLIAINPDGTEKWNYNTGDYIQSAPAISLGGSIIFGSADTYVYCLNPDGTLRWRFKTDSEVLGPASIAEDGTIYINSWDHYLYALNPSNGTMLWRCQFVSGASTNPSIGPDGTIYVTAKNLYAVNPNGTLHWTFILDTYSQVRWSSPAVSADGIIYFGTKIGNDAGGDFFAVNPDGTERWRFNIGNRGYIDSSPSIDSDGTIYFGSMTDMTGYLWAIGRGSLLVDALGPYNGYYASPINFSGSAYGGMPPYSYHWDFGDDNSSTLQNPSHTYATAGDYIATFTVTDNEGNTSSDTAAVTIRYPLPTVVITKPTNGLYILGARILPLPNKCLIIGPITVEAQADQEHLGIERIEFTVDGKIRITDTEPPYTWTWLFGFAKHTIAVTAYDTQGNNATTRIQVTRIF